MARSQIGACPRPVVLVVLIDLAGWAGLTTPQRANVQVSKKEVL
jgi:hypothetical protein